MKDGSLVDSLREIQRRLERPSEGPHSLTRAELRTIVNAILALDQDIRGLRPYTGR